MLRATSRHSFFPEIMKTPPLIAALMLLGLAACERQETGSDSEKADPPRKSGTASRLPQPNGQLQSHLPAETTPGLLADLIYRRPDADLLPLVESVCAQPSSERKSQLLATIYEDTQLRPKPTRLPLLLHLLRQQDLPSDLQATIRGELRATLQTDHGDSWADWSLALDEYLAEKHGLLRADE